MGQIGTLITFTNGTTADGPQVNTNFSDVKAAYNAHDTATDSVHGITSPDKIKGLNNRVQSVANAATITPNADTDDCVDITAIAQAFTIANPSGTPVNFQRMIIRIKDNGTARIITWGNGYIGHISALPSTTVLSKIMTLGFQYNTANALNKWCLLGYVQEA